VTRIRIRWYACHAGGVLEAADDATRTCGNVPERGGDGKVPAGLVHVGA
jgi:hypothetical protein